MRIVVNKAEIARLMSPTGDIGRASMRAAGRVRDRAKRNVSVDNGFLRNSIHAELKRQGFTTVVWRIGSPLEYALYQEVGTPPIFAKHAPNLKFQVQGRWVTTYSTQGVPAQRYLTRAIEATSVQDFR